MGFGLHFFPTMSIQVCLSTGTYEVYCAAEGIHTLGLPVCGLNSWVASCLGVL